MIHLGSEKAVYSLLLPEVKKVLNSNLNDYYIHTANKQFLDTNRLKIVETFKKWVRDIVDLSEFKYAYPMGGVTSSIEQWLLDNPGNIYQLLGEYGWMKIQRPWIGDPNITMETAYISNPFSATGNFHNNHKNLSLPTFLDCAFISSTSLKKIELTPNIKQIAFSFSKGFSVNLFRSGFLFSREPIPALEVWKGYNYFNIVSLEVSKRIMDNFSVNYVYEKLHNEQKVICEENDLVPSDCVFLATSTDPKYDHYKRGDGTNRICLSREFAFRGFGTFDFVT